MTGQLPTVSRTVRRRRVIAWALWDCGATGVNAVVVTFVFSVYLTAQVGEGLPGPTTPASWLGRALTLAGLAVAVLAPATGIWVDAPRYRRAALTVLTGVVAALTAAMALIRPDYHYLLPGLALLACAAACSDLATVPYNAVLGDIATVRNVGRISGIGSAAGFVGSVGLLLLSYVGFIAERDGGHGGHGLFGLPDTDGVNVRMVMVFTAVWLALFAWPLLRWMPVAAGEHRPPAGVVDAYRSLWREVRAEWRRDRNVVYYLAASAVFRDGLTGVFAFGAVLGVTVYGLPQGAVLIFGVCASTVAALGAALGGVLADRAGPKPVIVTALFLMIVTGLVLLMLSGPAAFWACGLLLCVFIGPILASARTLMLRLSTAGKEGMAFGLYTTAGRAASFLAPWMFFTFVDVFGADRAGLGGLCVVLAAGMIAMLAVRAPGRVT